MTPRTSTAAALTAGIFVATALVTIASRLHADEGTAPVVVTSTSKVEVRVQLAEGLVAPCDSGSNRMLLDGRLAPGATFRSSISGDCVCIRSTSASFPSSDWSISGLKCRPRVCRNKVCRPAADPTIRLTVP